MTNQAKLRSFRHSPKYKFGYQFPNNHAEAMLLDKKNLNSKWADAEEKERACFASVLISLEEVAPIIISLNDEDESPRKPMPIFDPTNLIGRTFLMDPQENGELYRTEILEALVESEEQLAKHPDPIKFVCSVNDDMYEEILTYNKILEYIGKNKMTIRPLSGSSSVSLVTKAHSKRVIPVTMDPSSMSL